MSYLQQFGRLLQLVLLVAIFLTSSSTGLLDENLKATFVKIIPSTNLTWYPCSSELPEYGCAVLDVPLDYDDPAGPRASLPLIKYPAANKAQSKGMILVNPGGPGASDISFLLNNARSFQIIVGDDYDFVAWEPRGVGYSNPMATCVHHSAAKFSRETNPKLDQLFDYDPKLTQEWLQAVQKFDTSCMTEMGGSDMIGSHMNTGVVAHDMLTILNAFASTEASHEIHDPHLLNYWGFSYGTLIGQTFASMFPDRIGRVVLDGVVDPDDYVTGAWLTSNQDTDVTFLTFFLSCFEAGPSSSCHFYRNATSPYEIFARFKRIVEGFRSQSSPVYGRGETTNTEMLQAIKDVIMLCLGDPQPGYVELADLFSQLEDLVLHNDFQARVKVNDSLEPFIQHRPFCFGGEDLAWFLGVRCSDTNGTLHNKSLEDLAPLRKELREQSYISGALQADLLIACSLWPIKGAGAWTGPFGANTSSPILFVGNSHDPSTPLLSSWNSAHRFGGLHLTIDGIGHTSSGFTNVCADRVIRTYFEKGLPLNEDLACPEEPGPFNVKTQHLETGEDWEHMKSDIQNWRDQSVLGDRWRGIY